MNPTHPLTEAEVEEIISKLKRLDEGDEVSFETDSNDRDIDTITVWSVDVKDDGVVVNFNNPNINVTDLGSSVEYLRASLTDDHFPEPVARLEEFTGWDVNHHGAILDVEIDDDGDATVTWSPL